MASHLPRLRTLLAAALLGGLAGCNTMAPQVKAQPPVDQTAWTLATLAGRAAPSAPVPTLSFESGRAQGSDGCNRFGGAYTVSGDRLQIGPNLVTTQRACPEPAQQTAKAFQAALAGAARYRIDGPRLLLLDSAGATLATFTAQATGLAGTSWQVGGYNNGRQAVVSVQAGTELTLEFTPDGAVAGSAGCNRYRGAYVSAGGQLSLSGIAATRRLCPQPKVMTQEAEFLRALETVATARREGDRLELRTATGALAATLTLAAPKP
jgi:heat shock protein HslJ